MAPRRVLWPVVCVALIGSVLMGLGHLEANTAPVSGRHKSKLLEIMLEGDSIDFTITDPTGNVAVIGIDSLRNLIPESDASRDSDDRMMEHSDDEDESEEPKEFIPFGGGNFVVIDPVPGNWFVRADARRACLDSCELNVTILHIGELQMDFIESLRTRLSRGGHAVMRVEVDASAERDSGAWARLRLHEVSKTAASALKRPGKPRNINPRP